ncbi:hypothetical protein L2729_16965 [Shewanella gelidimarina]|uniref:hypothetical protein n=1 Tax=Shewanella gelidimarina TaxID=56813 RepID=UPI00200E5703|nr:hypothetical protein [Shewanella gelidimarina]MCL1059663.1 hypothetical protein [Shewanella gelidimarina]
MFDNLDFKTVTSVGRSGSNDLISITHNDSGSKSELMFRLSKEVMDKAGFEYKDKVIIQFAQEDSICRILKSDEQGSVTLSKQVQKNPLSASIIRLTFKYGLPNFLERESKRDSKEYKKVKYVHEDEKIQYDSNIGQLTFKLKLEEKEEKGDIAKENEEV